MSYTPGCRCEDCDRLHVWRFARLSQPQQEAIETLSFAVPVHPAWLFEHHRLRGPTIRSLERMGLVRREYLYDKRGPDLAIPFLSLTQRGDEMRAAVARHPDWFEK